MTETYNSHSFKRAGIFKKEKDLRLMGANNLTLTTLYLRLLLRN